MKELLQLFFRLGIFAFGGPAAHIAMMQREVVEKRKWMSEEYFLDLIGATSLIPGPNSTEMVMHCGMHQKGLKGLFGAGLSFILPACLLTGILAYAYVEALEFSPDTFKLYLGGLYPAVFLLIVLAIKKLSKKALKSSTLAAVAFLVAVLCLMGSLEVIALFIGAFIGFCLTKWKPENGLRSIEPMSIFLVFLKIGSVLFGSGYVLIAYMQSEFVSERGWMTLQQIMDAIAFGQLTPGPVLSTATFAGYLMGGVSGAVWASIGIFLPSFLFVYLLHPLIPRMRASKNFGIFLDAVNASAIGLMAYVLIPMGGNIILSTPATSTLIFVAILLWKKPKLSSIRLVVVSFGFHAGLLAMSGLFS